MTPVLHEVCEELSLMFDVGRITKGAAIELLCYCWAIDLKAVKGMRFFFLCGFIKNRVYVSPQPF